MMKHNSLVRRTPAILIALAVVTVAVAAQTNLLLNPDAASKSASWKFSGEATVEEFQGRSVFAVRNRGSFFQDINFVASDIGKFALLIGRGSSERINTANVITGLPYLYGHMLDSTRNGNILEPIQGQQMLASARVKDDWSTMYGIFRIPENAGAIRFFLNQAERKDVPHNGSAARFDHLGLFLFETEKEARAFVRAYKESHNDRSRLDLLQ